MQDSRHKILVLTSRFPYPLEKGDKLRVYHQIKGLAKNNRVILVSLCEKDPTPEDKAKLEPYCEQIYTFTLTKKQSYLGVFRALFSGRPLQVGYFYSKRIHERIKRVILKEDPDYIFCQLLRMSEYCKEIQSCPKILDYMDAFSKGMQRRANESAFWIKPVFYLESARLRKYERNIFSYFHETCIISEQDREFISHQSKGEISIIRNGVDLDFFKPDDQVTTVAGRFLFVGNMSYYPNVRAAHYIAESILPQIGERIDSCQAVIAGASPKPEVLGLSSQSLAVRGWVEDIRQEYAAAQVFVAPMFHGSGLQNKILEAMAMGVPVICTPLANNAVQAEPGKEIMLANTPQEFADAIEFLMQNAQAARSQSEQARSFVQVNYGWDHFVSQLESLIKKNPPC